MAESQDPSQPPRRRRRAARRVAGPPAQAVTPDVADPVDPPATPVVPAIAKQAGEPAPTPDHSGAHAHGSPGAAPAGPAHPHPGSPAGHAPGPHRDHHERPAGPPPTGELPRRGGRTSREEASERSLRSLVTTRSTQLSPTAALRAREAAQPTDDDLATAEAELTIVRRHYVPPTALTTGRRQDWQGRRGSSGSRGG